MSRDDVYCLGIVTARGGSKGLQGKNLAEIGGKSLVWWAVRSGLESERCSRVICSTDNDAIAAEAVRAGADVPFMRPAELASDTSASIDAVLHALHHVEAERGKNVDVVCLLQPTTPLRTGQDVRATIDLLLEAGPDADSAVTVCEVPDAHPAWLRKIVDGLAVPYFGDADDEPTHRQQFRRYPPPYRRNGAVFVTRRQVLLELRRVFGRRCLAYVMPPERSFDVDTKWDLVCVQAIWEQMERDRDAGPDKPQVR